MSRSPTGSASRVLAAVTRLGCSWVQHRAAGLICPAAGVSPAVHGRSLHPVRGLCWCFGIWRSVGGWRGPRVRHRAGPGGGSWDRPPWCRCVGSAGRCTRGGALTRRGGVSGHPWPGVALVCGVHPQRGVPRGLSRAIHPRDGCKAPSRAGANSGAIHPRSGCILAPAGGTSRAAALQSRIGR